MTFILSPAPDPKSVAGPALRHAERVSLRLPASAPGIKSGNSEAPNPAAVMDAILLLVSDVSVSVRRLRRDLRRWLCCVLSAERRRFNSPSLTSILRFSCPDPRAEYSCRARRT
jgi:hypothetical protein